MTDLISTLFSPAPAPDRADKLALYGQFIGDWRFEAETRLADGRLHKGVGEIHFGWALAGRAIIDCWILPGIFHGTTLRVYDPGLDAWHIIWSDPLRQFYARQLGRAQGDGIVQEGTLENGTRTRWSFSDITPNSFTWSGEIQAGETSTEGPWQRQSLYHATRI